MRKTVLLFSILCLAGCSHTSEQVLGYNEKGQTIVRVCRSRGNLVNSAAFGSDCTVELRDYGRITNSANTINVISDNKR